MKVEKKEFDTEWFHKFKLEITVEDAGDLVFLLSLAHLDILDRKKIVRKFIRTLKEKPHNKIIKDWIYNINKVPSMSGVWRELMDKVEEFNMIYKEKNSI